MLRTAAPSSSRYYVVASARHGVVAAQSSSLQRLASTSNCTLRAPTTAPIRTLHSCHPSRSAATATESHRSRRTDTPPPPPSTRTASLQKGVRKTANDNTAAHQASRSASHKKSDASISPSRTTSPAQPVPHSTQPQQTKATPSASPSPPSPPQPDSDPKPTSASDKIKALYQQVKFLFRFYLNGVKQIWRDRQRVQQLRASVRETGRELDWAEQRLVRVHAQDLKKLPLFLAILIILEEILPLVVIYAPGLLPSTCILPSQLLKIRQKEEVRRTDAIQRLRSSKEVQELMSLAGWSVAARSGTGDKQDLITSVQDVFPRFGERGQDIAQRLKSLSRDTLVDFSQVFSLSTAMRPASMLRNKLESHLHFLTRDDYALRGQSAQTAAAAAAPALALPDYKQLPESGPELSEVSSQRGMRCCELESSDMFDNLRDWLKVTSVFAAPPASAESVVAPATTSEGPKATPMQLLFLPLLLYPAPLFTPSLKTLQAREVTESQKGILERSKEVAQEVIHAEELKAQQQKAVDVQIKEKQKSGRDA